MQTSAEIDKLAEAIAAAQGEFPTIGKNKTAKVKGVSRKTGKEYEMTYNYADIADVLDAVRPILSKHKIMVSQGTKVLDGGMYVETRLIHAGQWIACDYPVASVSGDHQQMGSALTYARRYALCALVGVAAEEDTDAQDAAEMPPQRPKPRPVDAIPQEAVPSRREAPKEYLNLLYGMIETYSGDSDGLKTWWNAEKPNMAARGLSSDDPTFRDLYNKFVAKGRAIAAAEKEREAA